MAVFCSRESLILGPGSILLERNIMSPQIRGLHSSELVAFIRNFVTATWDRLQDQLVTLSPHYIVNMS